MAKLKIVENGIKKAANKKRSTRRKKRHNSVKAATPRKAASVRAAAPVANKHRRKAKRRHNSALPVKMAANKPRRKTHKRRNGFLGNSKETGMKVLQVGAGVVATKTLGGMVGRFTNSTIAGFGLNQFAMPINEGLTAIGLWFLGNLIGKQFGLKDLGGDLFLGGLVVAGIDGANAAIPSVAPFNVFNSGVNTPVFLQGAAAGAVAAVNEVAKTGLPATAAKMGMLRGRMNASNVVPMMRQPDLNAAM